jgi:hypothetical protein
MGTFSGSDVICDSDYIYLLSYIIFQHCCMQCRDCTRKKYPHNCSIIGTKVRQKNTPNKLK